MRLRRPSVYPITHPALEGILGMEVYVEPGLLGDLVGFNRDGERLWIDMPINYTQLFLGLFDKLNLNFSYFGVVKDDKFTLCDVLDKKGVPIEHEEKFKEADRLGLECIQLLHMGALDTPEQLQGFLDQSPDGVLLKPVKGPGLYGLLTPDMLQNIVSAPSDIEVVNG